MIVQQFLRWVQTAPPGERADATSALARAYLHSPLDAGDRKAAEAAMTVLLDDASPMVREALAIVLAPSPHAPRPIIHALSQDQGEIASLVLAQSPLLTEAELIDAVALGDWRAQCSVACRIPVPVTLAGAIAEVGGADACLALLQNPDATLSQGCLVRIAERHGGDGGVREGLFEREDLPAEARQAAVAALSGSLADFVAGCGWLAPNRAARVGLEARDKASVTIAGLGREEDLRGLVRQLRRSGQLTPALVLRALLSANVRMFEEALSDLSGMPLHRVSGIIFSHRSGGFEALYAKCGLPAAALPAFQAALDAIGEQGFLAECSSEARLSRRMTERVLTSVDALGAAETEQLLLMLRRFAAEAARDEARAIAGDIKRDMLIAA
jgi:uncharacterized protein (DUF2336 family)